MDRCCDIVNNCPVTSLFTLHADLVSNMYRRRLPSSCSEAEFWELDEMIKMLKKHARQTSGKNQPSTIGISKFYLLYHIWKDIKAFGSIHYLSGGL